MLSSALLLVATAFGGLAQAQYYSQSGPLAIDPSSESPALRGQWCIAQLNNCPLICGGVANQNFCDPNTLDYTCTCANGNQPNISDYANTIPSYICADWKKFCVLGHPNDLDGITACQSVSCGNKTVDASSAGGSGAVSTSLTTTMSTSTTSSSSKTATSSSSTTTPAHNAAPIAMNLGNNYATGVTAAGFLAIFGLVL